MAIYSCKISALALGGWGTCGRPCQLSAVSASRGIYGLRYSTYRHKHSETQGICVMHYRAMHGTYQMRCVTGQVLDKVHDKCSPHMQYDVPRCIYMVRSTEVEKKFLDKSI